MNKTTIHILLACLFVVGLLASAIPAQAAPRTNGPSNAAELEAFLDGLLAAQMAENHIAGAVVAVAKDGKVLLSKGYGYADLEARTPVDPARTLFRPGSVSKLFVWTAVMQLAEQGKLNLNADINTYLDFTIPNAFEKPITLEHLMSHTPGFEDISQELFVLHPEAMHPLGDYLKSHIPERVFPPGEIGAYSNYGTALAGYIVERVSGVSFDAYVEQNIFAPLGMANSTFRQPLPEVIAADMSGGYNYINGGYLKAGFEYVQPYPAGSLSAPANDMAKFMIAHLQNGHYEDQRILQEATARQMHNQLFTHDPRLDGMAHGFFENVVNGQRTLSHGGDTILFHTGLFLIPTQNLGLYISTNSVGGAGVGEAVIKAFLDRYYPADDAPIATPPADFTERIGPYLGEYYMSRSNFTTIEKIFALFTPVSASLNEDGYLVIAMAGEALQYTDIEPGLLQQRDEPGNQLVYRTDAQGQAMLLPAMPFVLLKKPWHGSMALHGLIFFSALVLFGNALWRWPMGFLKNLRKREPQPILARLAHWNAGLFGLFLVMFVVGFLVVMGDIIPAYGIPRIVFEEVPLIHVLGLLPWLMALTGMAMLVFLTLAWIKAYWTISGRIFYTLLTLSALAWLWMLSYWNFWL